MFFIFFCIYDADQGITLDKPGKILKIITCNKSRDNFKELVKFENRIATVKVILQNNFLCRNKNEIKLFKIQNYLEEKKRKNFIHKMLRDWYFLSVNYYSIFCTHTFYLQFHA